MADGPKGSCNGFQALSMLCCAVLRRRRIMKNKKKRYLHPLRLPHNFSDLRGQSGDHVLEHDDSVLC